MTMLPIALLLAAAGPFWETRAPVDWTDEEIQELLNDSPWARPAQAALQKDGITVFLATARPILDAEAELERRNAKRGAAEDPERDEYREFVRENRGKIIVLAISFSGGALENPAEVKRLEEECVLKVGRRRYKIAGHFPPTGLDPRLRLVFPQAVGPSDKGFGFDLYLPGVPSPYRTVEFRVKELVYRGRPEM